MKRFTSLGLGIRYGLGKIALVGEGNCWSWSVLRFRSVLRNSAFNDLSIIQSSNVQPHSFLSLSLGLS